MRCKGTWRYWLAVANDPKQRIDLSRLEENVVVLAIG